MLQIFHQNLIQLSGRINRLEETALQAGLQEPVSAAEIKIIQAIGPEGSVKMGNIAASLGISLATLTVSCDKLEGRGFVQRRRDEHDKRTVSVTLTEKGLVAYRFHNSFVQSLLELMESGLSDEERNALARGLSNLNKMFEDLTKEADYV